MENTIVVIDDPLFAAHSAESPHPERPERLEAARRGLEQAMAVGGQRRQVVRLDAPDATAEQITRVHTADHLALLAEASGSRGYFDPDTYFGPQSVAAAYRAAGGVAKMAEALLGEPGDRHGLALVRPPGHHARPDRPMGFCLLNNIAIGTAAARATGASRVAIVDWDVHHGNGTQEMFYRDPTVLYVSLHQAPYYPGTGGTGEIGDADGRGFNVNVPLSAGASDAVYAAAFRGVVQPIVSQFDPDLLLVSAGFDAHARDPLAGMSVTEAGFAFMIDALVAALPPRAKRRVGLVLEGGYDLQALTDSVAATVRALMGPGAASEPGGVVGRHHAQQIERAAEQQREFWRL